MSREQSNRLKRERRTIEAMIRIFCRARHVGESVPCPECDELEAYALCRLDRCPYGADKPTCTSCPIHCYRPEYRERVRDVMQFAGPRMATRHPVLALRHLIDERQEPPARPGSSTK